MVTVSLTDFGENKVKHVWIAEDWATLEGPFGPIVFATKFAVSGAEVC